MEKRKYTHIILSTMLRSLLNLAHRHDDVQEAGAVLFIHMRSLGSFKRVHLNSLHDGMKGV